MKNWLLIPWKPTLEIKKPLLTKIQKTFEGKLQKTQLSLSKLSFDKKYWLNFLEFPFSSRHRRPETRPDILPKKFFHLTGYLVSVCIRPEWIPSPETKVISLPLLVSIQAQPCLTVTLQHLESALGYPIVGCRVDRTCVGYPSAHISNCQPRANRKCTRPGGFTRRSVLGRPGVGIQCRQFVKVADSQG